jgi:hypothetical protein
MMRILPSPSQPHLILEEDAARTNALNKGNRISEAKDEAAIFIRSTSEEVAKVKTAEPLRHHNYNYDSVHYRAILNEQATLRQTICKAIQGEIMSGEGSRDRQQIVDATIVATCELVEDDSRIIASHPPASEAFQVAHAVERGELLLALKQAVASRPAVLQRFVESIEEMFVANRLLGDVKMARLPSTRPFPASEAPT